MADAKALATEVARQLHVGLAIADHRAAGKVDVAVAQVMHQQSDARLSRRLVLMLEAFVDQDLAERDALRFQQLQQQALRPLESLPRVARRAEAVLVADHDEFESRVAQLQQRRDHVVEEADFVVGVHLEVVRLLDQCAVAIDEEEAFHGVSASSTASFSAALPTVMRSASRSCGAARMSRTTTPRASSASNAACASSKRTSRKLPCEA
jgi:hypothetical protein